MKSVVKMVFLGLMLMTLLVVGGITTDASSNAPLARNDLIQLAASPGGEAEAGDVPDIEVVGAEHDFGTLRDDQKAHHEFAVRNKGTGVLKISNVRVGCGCTVAHYDRAIPPGEEGKVTLEITLRGYQGIIRKSATIMSNDPDQPQIRLTMEGEVQPYIEIKPVRSIYFRGMSDGLEPMVTDIVSQSQPFSIEKIEGNLKGKIDYRLETIKEGEHYRLTVTNLAEEGEYHGHLLLHTNHPKQPQLQIRVNGYIQGIVGVQPNVVFVGRLRPGQDVATAKVVVRHNENKPFEIAKLKYDEQLLEVSQQELAGSSSYQLEIVPRVDDMPKTNLTKTTLTIETDVEGDSGHEVNVQIVNR